MHHGLLFLLLPLIPPAVEAGAGNDAAPGAARAGMSAEECEVWERERSFARSVEERDAEAFAGHLHPGAVFIAGERVLRGREAVAQGWASIVANEGVVLRWHPRNVAIGGEPDIAHSRGPYWLEDPGAGAEPRYLLGNFVSVWKRSEGEWKVLFDGGGGVPQPASTEEINQLRATLQERCPRG